MQSTGISRLINSMTPEQRDNIHLMLETQYGIMILCGKKVNERMLEYAVAKLNGQNVKPPAGYAPNKRRKLHSKEEIKNINNNSENVNVS
jgi:hypothetical protein